MLRPSHWLPALAICLPWLGCSGEDEQIAPAPSVMPGPAEWNRKVVPPTDAEADGQRIACGYVAGMLGVTSTLVMWAVAIIAAIVLLFVYEMVRKKNPKPAM